MVIIVFICSTHEERKRPFVTTVLVEVHQAFVEEIERDGSDGKLCPGQGSNHRAKLNPGKPVLISESGDKSYHTYTSILLDRLKCVGFFVARFRRCSRDAYQESCITKYTSIRGKIISTDEAGGGVLRQRRCGPF